MAELSAQADGGGKPAGKDFFTLAAAA